MEVHNKATALERQLWRGNSSVGPPVSLRPAVCLSALSNVNPPLWAGSGRVPAVPQEEQRGGSEGGGEAPSVPGREALRPRPVHHTPHEQGTLELHVGASCLFFLSSSSFTTSWSLVLLKVSSLREKSINK